MTAGQKIFTLITAFVSGTAAALVLPDFKNAGLLSVSKEKMASYLGRQEEFKIIGFLPFWLIKEDGPDYSPYLSDLAYFSLNLKPDGRIFKLINPQEEDPGWTHFQSQILEDKLRLARQKGLRLSLVLHCSDESTIKDLVDDPVLSAQQLVSEVNPLLDKYRFDDLNLDIESFQIASASARRKATLFFQEVKKRLRRQSITLTVEVAPIALLKPMLIDAVSLGEIADSLVLMAYDFHYINSALAGPIAPLSGAGTFREYDVESALKEALRSIPKEKLILGIPLYGYEWETLAWQPGSPVIPGGASLASQKRVAELLSDCFACQTGFDSLAGEPYLVYPDESSSYYHQFFYENAESVRTKLELAKRYQLAGVALWALGYEAEGFIRPLKGVKR